MNDLERVLKAACDTDKIRTWKFSFINEKTQQPCNLQVTGVGLGSGGGKTGDVEWYDAIILMDNLQLFYLYRNETDNSGRYVFANSLDELREMDIEDIFLLGKAEDTIEWYPF